MKKLWLLLLPLLAVLALAGCGKGINSGLITSKQFIPGYTEHYFEPVCVIFGKYGCSLYIEVPESNYISDAWYLNLKACKGDPPKCKTGYVTVTQRSYGSYLVGRQYP